MPASKRTAKVQLVGTHQLHFRTSCTLVGLSRNANRYKPQAHKDTALKKRLNLLTVQHPRYGYLMLHVLLQGEGLVTNNKRTYRLYREQHWQVRTKRRKQLQNNRLATALPKRL